jgi:hypothetical protein
MCPFCFDRSPGRDTTFSPARFADFAERTHATLLYANAMVCLGRGFEPTACRPCQRTSFESLVAVSRSFIAEFKDHGRMTAPTSSP